MIGELTKEEMQTLLKEQLIGRMACYGDGQLYLVPVSYAYHEQYIYVRSLEGLKIDIMRRNPDVCFEVDNVSDMANWRSVVVWGRFEELENENRKQGVDILLRRHMPMNSSSLAHLSATWPFKADNSEDVSGVIFRIVISRMTGKFERNSFEGAIVD